MLRRELLKKGAFVTMALLLGQKVGYAKTYMQAAGAKSLILGKAKARKVDVVLTRAQMKAIQKASGERVRHAKINAYVTKQGDWLIFDQVIGKHENIDMAFGLTRDGKIKGIEVLVYRETYGSEIREMSWKKQFYGRGPGERLKLDKQIRNISGATLSCSHVTGAVNRLTQTWALVLRNLI